jgi:hypothetical protein
VTEPRLLTDVELAAVRERRADPDPDRCLDIVGLYDDASSDRAALLDHVDVQAREIARLRIALLDAAIPLEVLAYGPTIALGTGSRVGPDVQTEIETAVASIHAALGEEAL